MNFPIKIAAACVNMMAIVYDIQRKALSSKIMKHNLLISKNGVVTVVSVVIVSLLLFASSFLYYNETTKYFVDYDFTECKDKESNISCREMLSSKNREKPCVCSINIENFFISKKTYYLHIVLKKVYTNSRGYHKNVDFKQLYGKFNMKVSKNCYPLDYTRNMPNYPCGSIPSSVYNDTFQLFKDDKELALDYNGLKFPGIKNPNNEIMEEIKLKAMLVSPWETTLLGVGEYETKGFLDFSFLSWLSSYPFPDTMKYQGKVKLDQVDKASVFKIQIIYDYNVYAFNGKKILRISKKSLLGNYNGFLGRVYIIVAAISSTFSFIFLIFHLISSKFKKNQSPGT